MSKILGVLNEGFTKKYMPDEANVLLGKSIKKELKKRGYDISTPNTSKYITEAVDVITETRKLHPEYLIEEYVDSHPEGLTKDVDEADEKEEEKVFHNDNGVDYDVIERSSSGKNALLRNGKQWIIAWNCPEDSGSWGQGHYFFDEAEARKVWEDKYVNESLNEAPINKKEDTNWMKQAREQGYSINELKKIFNSYTSYDANTEPKKFASWVKKYIKNDWDWDGKNIDESLNEAMNMSHYIGKPLKDFLIMIDHRTKINLESEDGYDPYGGFGNTKGLNGLAHDVGWYLADKKIKDIKIPKDKRFYEYEILIEGMNKDTKLTDNHNRSYNEPLQERVNPRVKRYFEPTYSKRYKIRGYFDPDFRGLSDSMESDDFDEIRSVAHDYLSDGSCIIVNDYETGKVIRLTPDEYFGDFEGEGIQEYMFESVGGTDNRKMNNCSKKYKITESMRDNLPEDFDENKLTKIGSIEREGNDNRHRRIAMYKKYAHLDEGDEITEDNLDEYALGRVACVTNREPEKVRAELLGQRYSDYEI